MLDDVRRGLAWILGTAGAVMGGIAGAYAGTALQHATAVSGRYYVVWLLAGAFLGGSLGAGIASLGRKRRMDGKKALPEPQPDVEALERAGDVVGLIHALRSEAQMTRALAILDLAASKDPRVVSLLIDALQDPDWHMRWPAAETLGKLGDSQAVEPLTHALDDKSSLVRNAAKTALDALERRGPRE